MLKLIKDIFSHLFTKNRLIKRDLQFYQQRRKWGFDDSDLWNLDMTIAEFALPRIKKFREANFCYPNGTTLEEWNEILDKIIFAFEKITQDKHLEFPKEIQEGTELFGKWMQALWW